MRTVKRKKITIKKKPKVLTPPVKKGQCPPFWEMDEYPFQDMCCALLEMEEDVSTCSVFGDRGQAQFGIDLIADRKIDGECYVAQCKCWKEFPPNKIQEASEEFFKYWDDKWSKENVKRFYLMVACDMPKTQQQHTIREQKRIFKKKGVEYEVWSSRTLCNKFGMQPGIISQHLDEGWVKIICSTYISSLITSEKSLSILNNVLGNQLQQASSVIDQDTNIQLDEMREAFRIGNNLDAIEWINKIKSDTDRWTILKPDIQANILRFETSLQIEKGDFEYARTLSEKARSLTPDYDDSVLRALLVLYEHDPELAIKVLNEDISNPDAINLKALLLLQIGHVSKCGKLLDKHTEDLKDNPETMRIKSLMYRISRDLESARESIESAYKKKPEWVAIRFVKALIDFESALAPGTLQGELCPPFEIIDWSLIRRDDQSIDSIRRACRAFDELINITGNNLNQRSFLEGWKLTCLSCDFERQGEAERYCKELLKSQPEHPVAIMWALGRKYALETLNTSISHFESLYITRKIKTQQIVRWIICLAAQGNLKKAISVLNKTKHSFKDNEDKIIWILWKTQCLAFDGQIEKANQIFNKISDKTTQKRIKALILKASLNKKQNYNQVIKYLISIYNETLKGKYLFDACSIMANQNQWDRISEYIEVLINAIGTSEVVRLCAYTLYNTKKYQECLNFLEKYKDTFRNNIPTHDIRQIQVLCQISLGQINTAVEDASKLYKQDPSIWNLRAFIKTLYYKGDFSTLEILSKKALSEDNLPHEVSLFLCENIKSKNPELAREILRKLFTQPIQDNLVLNTLQESLGLGIENEANNLFSRLSDLSQQPESGIKIISYDDFLLMMKENNEQKSKINDAFLKAEIPIHFWAENISANLAVLYHTNLFLNQKNENFTPFILTVRHGGLPVAKDLPPNKPNWRLSLDLTALLLANHIDILDYVEKTFAPLRISLRTIPALKQMRENLVPHQPSQLEAQRKVCDLVKTGKIVPRSSYSFSYNIESKEILKELPDEWISFFKQMSSENGYLIDFLPPHHKDDINKKISLPDFCKNNVTNIRALIDSLYQYGPLSKPEYEKAIELSGMCGREVPFSPILSQGCSIHLHNRTAELLANCNLLELICQRFTVSINTDELEYYKNEVEKIRPSLDETIQFIDNLIDRISRGIDSSIYETLPIPTDQEQLQNQSLQSICLYDIISQYRNKFSGDSLNCIWCLSIFSKGYNKRRLYCSWNIRNP